MSEDKSQVNEAATLTVDTEYPEGIVTQTFVANDQEGLARLLQLAGRPNPPVEMEAAKKVLPRGMGYIGVYGHGDHDHNHDDAQDGLGDLDMGGDMGMGESIGDHDYGDNPTSRKGETLDYDFPSTIGKADAKVRYVPSRSGDNPLAEDSKSFRDYLKETEEAIEEAGYKQPVFPFGPPQYLLPTGTSSNFEELLHDPYLGDGLDNGDDSYWVIVVGKQDKHGRFTPRYCGSHGSHIGGIGQSVTIVHDQNGGKTAGKVLYQFSGAQYMNPETHQQVAAELQNAGVDVRRRYACKVYK